MYKLRSLFFLLLFHQIIFAQSAILEYKIDSLMKKYETIGLAIAVVKENQVIYNQSFGLKNIESKEQLKNSDIFRIASISKSFAATSIMQLIAQKKLSLESDVSDLVGFKVRNPNFPEVKISIKMLLSHTSSINDKEGYFTLDVINPDKNKNWTNCYSKYQPGKNYAYCNLNFNLTGAIVERLSNERYDKYVKNHILKPLNIYGGLYVDSLDSIRFVPLYNYNKTSKGFEYSADAYAPRRENFKNYTLGYSTPILSPTGGMKISAEDLAKYMMMHINYGKGNSTRIIPRKYAKLMQSPVNKESGYGLALLKTKTLISGQELAGHTGSAYGLFSAMFFNPKKKFGFVVITNGTASPYGKNSVLINEEIINILYKDMIVD